MIVQFIIVLLRLSLRHCVFFLMLKIVNVMKFVYSFLKVIIMCSKNEKIKFVDDIVEQLAIYCPQMSNEVMYFVACQFALESNFGKSRLAKTKNNLCGMKIPKSRLTLNVAVSGEFAQFNSMIDCIVDYCYWLAWNNFTCVQLFNLELFSCKLIAKGYCPDDDYIDRIFSIYNSLKY